MYIPTYYTYRTNVHTLRSATFSSWLSIRHKSSFFSSSSALFASTYSTPPTPFAISYYPTHSRLGFRFMVLGSVSATSLSPSLPSLIRFFQLSLSATSRPQPGSIPHPRPRPLHTNTHQPTPTLLPLSTPILPHLRASLHTQPHPPT